MDALAIVQRVKTKVINSAEAHEGEGGTAQNFRKCITRTTDGELDGICHGLCRSDAAKDTPTERMSRVRDQFMSMREDAVGVIREVAVIHHAGVVESINAVQACRLAISF